MAVRVFLWRKTHNLCAPEQLTVNECIFQSGHGGGFRAHALRYCACVSPVSLRAAGMASNIGISSRSMRSYSARTAGLDSAISLFQDHKKNPSIRHRNRCIINGFIIPGLHTGVSRRDILRNANIDLRPTE